MLTRIRYIKQLDGTYVSARFIPLRGGKEARVSLEPAVKRGIVHVDNDSYIVTGTSLHKIKIAAKNKLIELGAEFTEETRGDDGIE